MARKERDDIDIDGSAPILIYWHLNRSDSTLLSTPAYARARVRAVWNGLTSPHSTVSTEEECSDGSANDDAQEGRRLRGWKRQKRGGDNIEEREIRRNKKEKERRVE